MIGPKLTLFVVENGVVRSQPVPVDEDYGVKERDIEEGWKKLGIILPDDPLAKLIIEHFDRKRAVRFN